jgi:hypothetical protein
VLGKKLVINVGSGARRNCDVESVLADRLRTEQMVDTLGSIV